ncbi:hypothetical protein [Mycoplasmopsis felifaucium]|uniref:Uncharacterized protein n=1 Tax=Mycoplasmopsis felifaucium TaxID=35768 RepID=A0ABZ2RSC6_9BACT
MDKLTRIVNGLTGVSITLKWICGTTSFVSALSTISTFFTFGTTSGIAGVAGIVALVSGVLTDVLDGIVHYYKTELKNTQKMIELVNASRQYTPHFLIEKFVKAGADVAYYVGEKLLTKSIKEFAKLMKYADVINSFKTGVDRFKDSINGILYLADINKESKKSNEKLVGIASQISKMKKVKWTVLHESPLDRHYILGGAGGINQIFKNIETGQILGLDEMLQYSKFELYSMGLTKALHPKTGWYIRTLPNDTKIDNLG